MRDLDRCFPLARWYRVGREALCVVAAAFISRFVDQRIRRDRARASQIWPTLPFLLDPVVVPLPKDLGEPPQPLERLVHLRIGIRNGVGTALAQHEIHTARIDQKTSRHGLLEHPLERNLGEAALGLRITAADVPMDPWKPDLSKIRWTALRWRTLRHPEIRTEKSAALVDRDSVAPNLNITIVGRIRQTQRIFVPADRTHSIPHTNKPRLADLRRKSALEVICQGEIPFFCWAATATLAVNRVDRH